MLRQHTPTFLEELESHGFAVLPYALDACTVKELIGHIKPSLENSAIIQRESQTFAIRNLLNVVPEIRDFAESSVIRRIVEQVLGKKAQITRGIFFDKLPTANWKVPWHQDVTISVKEKREVKGFTSWTVKAGIPHVQPPVHVMEGILTIRIHLDKADESNGALKVIPGSHKLGRLSDSEVRILSQEGNSITCCLEQGGILSMRPLLLHASASGNKPNHRRVIHFEFSATELPGGLEWFGT
jgi:ectoine hydroxylase-related dioxygenase (phytanoyl-CoA dioxygenase family)